MSVSFINESRLEKKTRIISSRKRFHKNIEFFFRKRKTGFTGIFEMYSNFDLKKPHCLTKENKQV